MDKTAEELYRGNEGWESLLSKTQNWRKALEFTKQKHNRQTETPSLEHIKGIMGVLVTECNITDDMILTIAALNNVLNDTDCTKRELEQNFGKITADCVDLLTQKDGQSSLDYSKQVFTNEEYLLIRQVELADRLYQLRALRANNNPEEIAKKMQETETCILPYEKCAPRNLMNKIKEELDTLKSAPSSKKVTDKDEIDEYSL